MFAKLVCICWPTETIQISIQSCRCTLGQWGGSSGAIWASIIHNFGFLRPSRDGADWSDRSKPNPFSSELDFWSTGSKWEVSAWIPWIAHYCASAHCWAKSECWKGRNIVVESTKHPWSDLWWLVFPLPKTELLTLIPAWQRFFFTPPPPRSSAAFQKNNTNYCDSKQLHVMTSTSTVLRCKCTKETSLLGDITVCCPDAARDK